MLKPIDVDRRCESVPSAYASDPNPNLSGNQTATGKWRLRVDRGLFRRPTRLGSSMIAVRQSHNSTGGLPPCAAYS